MNLYHPPSSLSAVLPPIMNYQGPVNHPIYDHPYLQAHQASHYGEQHIPSTTPSYHDSSDFTPSPPYSHDHVDNYHDNHEQTIPGNDSYQLTISLELLEQRTTFERLARAGPELEEIVFLGPRPDSLEFFLNSRPLLNARLIHLLEHIRYLKKVTLSLDFTDLTSIFETLGKIYGMNELELILPTSNLERHSMDMVHMQRAFIYGLNSFTNLKRLTIPMEFITTLLLSYLAILPNLNSLTVKYTPPPRSPPQHHQQQQQQQQQQFPGWSSHTIPAECPGYVFLAHLKFDPRGYFKQLKRLDLRAPLSRSDLRGPLSDVSYTSLRTLFPDTYICCTGGMA